MKYLLVAHYAGFDLYDPEDLVNSSWFVGEAMTETEAIDLAAKEIDNYVNEQVESRFDLDDEDLDEEEVEDFKDSYKISIKQLLILRDKSETIAHLYKNAEYYFEDLKIDVIMLGE